MKTNLFLAAICGLMMACVPMTNNNDVPSGDTSSDPSENPSQDPDTQKEEDSFPEGAISGWVDTAYSGDDWSNTSTITFHYDSKGRVYSYDEHVEHANGNKYDYVRCYVWVTDTRVEFRNTNPSHETTFTWFLNPDGTTKRVEIPKEEDEYPSSWSCSYTSDGHLKTVQDYCTQYISETDVELRKDWNKRLELTWDEDGNLTKSEEVWVEMPSGRHTQYRQIRKFSYVARSKNPFLGQVVDPIAYHIFDTMWLGLYGKTTAGMIDAFTLEEKDPDDPDDPDVYEKGDGYSFSYAYCEDGILREMYVLRKENGMKFYHKYHFFYYGIEDKDPYTIPEIN